MSSSDHLSPAEIAAFRAKIELNSIEIDRIFAEDDLVAQVQKMVDESGRPDGFNAKSWVYTWLRTENMALGGRTPLSYLETADGQQLVSRALATTQSGVYL